MKSALKLSVAAACAIASTSAVASDGFGIVTYVLGVPLLLAASLVLGLMLNLAPSRTVRIVSIVIFVPALLISLYLIPDALSLFRYGFRRDSWIGVAFFGLLPLVCLFFFTLVRR